MAKAVREASLARHGYVSLPDDDRRLALAYEHGFSAELPLTVGLEEELILVDPDSLLPVDRIDWVLEKVGGDSRFKTEFRASQLELCTPVCLTVGDLARELAGARADVLARIDGRLRLSASAHIRPRRLRAASRPASVSAKSRRIAPGRPGAGSRAACTSTSHSPIPTQHLPSTTLLAPTCPSWPRSVPTHPSSRAA
jgi:hypothetical protein